MDAKFVTLNFMRIKAIIVMAAAMRGLLSVPTKIDVLHILTKEPKSNISRIFPTSNENEGLVIGSSTPFNPIF